MAKQIVVVDRGWVFVGDVADTDTGVTITNCQNIRYWGTEELGLGGLINGPLPKTKLDKYGDVHIPKHAVIMRMDVNTSGGGGW